MTSFYTLGKRVRGQYGIAPQWLLLLCLLLPVRGWAQTNQGLVADSTELRVLRQFYASTKGDQWVSSNRTNWPTTPAAWATATVANAATWTGIGVANGDISSISMGQLLGTLPSSIGLLRGLTTLDLPYSPALTGPLPASIGQLTKLIYLSTFKSGFSGPLPATIGNLTQLQAINLRFCFFTGSLPATLGNLQSLQALDVGSNRFTGSIPPELGKLTQLRRLGMGNYYDIHPGEGNAFTGGIPKELGQLTNLTFLDLSLNPIGGTIPVELGQLRNLTFLELDDCGMQGAVPVEVLQLPSLNTLILGTYNLYYKDGNRFSSLPPPSVVTTTTGLYLGLEYNQFEFGTLEPYFSGPKQLRPGFSANYLNQTLPQNAQIIGPGVGQAVNLPSAIGGTRTHYQWQRRVGGTWVNLTSPSATTATYQLAAAALSDAGAYRCQATNDWVTDLTLTTRVYTLDVRERGSRNLPDDTNRGLALATSLLPADATAEKPKDMNYVRTWVPREALTTTGLAPAAAAQTAADKTAAQAVPGTLLYERWANVYGPADLDQLPLTRPATTQALPSFEAPSGQGDNYGARLRGYLLPPVTGSYTLYLSGDDVAQLWLSPDTNPAHVALVASLPDYTGTRQWTKFPAQRALPVTLVAGQRYYVEVLHRQGGGSDAVAVAWVRPDQPGASPTTPIASQFLAPAPVTAAPMAPNLVINPSFDAEQQASASPYGWSVTPGAGTDANASYNEAYGGGHTGAYHGSHYRPNPYEVYTYQTLTGLAPGTYTLRAWVRSTDGQSKSVLRARFYGGTAREVGVPAGVTDWVRVEIPNLVVTTGQCQVGVYSKAAAGQSLHFDDIALTRQDGPAPPPTTQSITLANPGFEADGQTSYAPQGWQVRVGGTTATAASYAEAYGGAYKGNFHGTHYRPDAYEVYTYQTLTGLMAGTYTLRAWLRSSDGQSQSVLRGSADGGAVQQMGLPAGASEWTLVTLPNLVVTKGQLEVGVYSNAAAGQVLYFDDFTLERQLSSSTPAPTTADEPTWTVDQAQVTTQYLDGLGRPVQTVLHQASPQKRDLVQPQTYDVLGREPRQYLPFPADLTETVGSYRYQALTQQQEFYKRTTVVGGGQGPLDPNKDPIVGVARTGVGYAETEFEASPLNRVLKQGAAGEAWQLGQGHAQQRLERPNVLTDSIPYLQVGYDRRGTDSNYKGFYAVGELWGTQTTDEGGSRAIEWRDKLGQVVLKQVESSRPNSDPLAPRRWLRTAYGYDDFQRLRIVLQPEGIKRLLAGKVQTSILPFTFSYRYDGRGRQIAKLVPGQDDETLVIYDQLDRPVLSQDAQQRTRREWSWTKYDALGRIVLSGLVSRADTMGQVRLQALATADTVMAHQYEKRTASISRYVHGFTTDQSFPQLGQQGFGTGQVLTITYYDDYDFDNNGQADGAYDPQSDGQFASGQAPLADALRTQGLTTRTKTRVLGVAENDAQQASWLTTTTFYDERARPVQVQTINARKGTDILTTQLDFTGKVVQSVTVHQGPNHPPVQVAEFFGYDHTGRLLTTRQQLPGEAQPTLLASVQYNEIGQATRKTLGTGRLKQEVDYAYNIRGWLTSLNDPYQPVKEDLFNLSLHYEAGFTKGYEQYNGNLTGQTWRGHDGVQRAYGYVYDPLNRLLQGDFVARAGGGQGTLNSAMAWNQELDDYRLNAVSYDDNGNINTLRRRGLWQNATSKVAKQYGAVDDLSYTYVGNRLQVVNDQVTGNQLAKPATYHGAPTSLAGDFQEAGVRLSQEYFYDAVGNLTQDKNKGITNIRYNHLNLPQQIRFGQGADSVVFRYTASGQKVAKLVYQTGKPAQRTDYLGPYQYEQDSLRFFPHSEGRVLRVVSYDNSGQASIRYQREFTFKDHLGNLRLAYRLGQKRTYSAGLELDQASQHRRETQQFDSLSVSAPTAQAVGSLLARTGSHVARLNAGDGTRQPLGPLTQLTVQKGDSIRALAFGYYPEPVNNNSFGFSLASFVASLLQPAPAGQPMGFDSRRRGGLALLQIGLGAGLAAVPQLGDGVPKGYLRVFVFNEDSVLVDSRMLQLSKTAHSGYDSLRTGYVPIRQNGYVMVYVGNESSVDVYFDDIQVEHCQGVQVQENEYDPYGLDLAGISGTAPGLRLKNFYQFNGKENQLDLGLNWNHHDWRFFDYQLGRWHSADPLIEDGLEHWTPYAFGFDNAVRYNDPDGQFPPLLISGAVGAAVGAVIGAGVEAGTQMYNTGGHVSDWHAVGGAALQGGVTGGLAGLTGGTSLLRSGAAGAISNVGGGIARNLHDGKPVTVGSVTKDAAVGALTGVAGHAASKVASAVINRVKGGAAAAEAEVGAGARAAKAPCGCFTAGTGVSTRAGRKAIERVQIGDSVWAYNERTHSTALRPVTHIFRHERDTVYVLHTSTGEALRTTSDHPFYVRGQWVRVKRLRVGDSLVSQSGQRHMLRRIDLKPEHVTVYNFTVDELHTYFVGQNAILVHNSGPCPSNPGGPSPRVKQIADKIKQLDKDGRVTPVKPSELAPGQEFNITIKGEVGENNLNIRVESHKLSPRLGGKPDGSPTRHMNVEPMTPKLSNGTGGNVKTKGLPNEGHIIL
jgi:RHS repeat-associated protein